MRKRWKYGVPAGLLMLMGGCTMAAVTTSPTPISNVSAVPPAITTVAAPVPPPRPAGVLVTNVADGDTVGLADGRKIRLLGIDTPESVKPNAPVDCYGLEASAFAKRTLLGVAVVAQLDSTQGETDRYGRTLAYLALPDGRDYSVMAAEAGVARSYVYQNRPVRKAAEIAAAEQRAQAARLGLWGACPAPAATTPSTAATPRSAATSRPRATTRTPAPTLDDPPAPAPPRATGSPRAPSAGFPNCAAARAAGAAPLHRGDPGWSSRLDGDGDGTACERS